MKDNTTYHVWGDNWPFWTDLDKAVCFINTFCRRYGRFSGQAKEKWGTLRFYCHFHYFLHDLIYPGYVWIQWGRIGKFLERIYGISIFKYTRKLISWYQTKIYSLSYWIAVRRWPHIMPEIVIDCDYPELLPKKLEEYRNQFWSDGTEDETLAQNYN